MASHKSERTGKIGKGTDGGLHDMPSGLYHTADSLADGPHGLFVDRFGPPGDPTLKSACPNDGDAMGIGRAPALLKTMQSTRQRSNARS